MYGQQNIKISFSVHYGPLLHSTHSNVYFINTLTIHSLNINTKNSKAVFILMPPDTLNYILFWKVPRPRSFDKNSVSMKMSMEHWRNDSGEGKPTYSEKNLA